MVAGALSSSISTRSCYDALVKRFIFVLATLLCPRPALAQQADVERYVREHQAAIVREFMDLVSIPNVRTDLPNIKRNAEQLRQMLDRRGMKPEVWETPSTPLVYGERLVPGATRTVLFYIHFDGQPVDKARWTQPDPFRPVLRAGSLEQGAEEIVDCRRTLHVSRRLAHLRALRGRRQGTDSGVRVGDGRDWRQADRTTSK